MTVFLILYECALFSSIVPPVYFPFELVLPVNEGESVRGGMKEQGSGDSCTANGHTFPMMKVILLVPFSAAPLHADNIPAP